MDDVVQRCAEAARAALTRPPSEGFVLEDVRAHEQDVEVAFRWHRDPSTFVMRFPAREAPGYLFDEVGPADAGWPVAWADGLHLWLMEELDTGLMSRARRTRLGDQVLLTAPTPTEWSAGPSEVCVSEVPQYSPRVSLPARVRARLLARSLRARITRRPDPGVWVAYAPLSMEPGDGSEDGRHLTRVGLDISLALSLRQRGQLTAWVQAYRDDTGCATLGHAVVGPVRSGRAGVVLLETVPDAPHETSAELVALALRLAADAGAATVDVPAHGDRAARSVDTALLEG